jgi:GAF domain-containing protein
MTATVDTAVADLQRANAELQRQLGEYRAERDEAFAQQTATAEVLQVINASPGDLAPVFDAMVERAVRLCEADEAAVRTFDGELLHLAAAHGDPAVIDTLRQLGPSIPDGLYGPIARGERVTHIADVRETDAFHDNPRARERLKVRNIRSWLAVALCKEGALLGVINVHRHEVRPFSDKQVALLQNFAAQAVIAMENARLITETREALERQTATAEVLGVINASPGDLTPVFDAMLEKALRLCDAAFGNLWTYDGEIGRLAAIRGASPEYRAELMRAGPQKPEPGGSLIRLVEGEPLVHIADITADGAHRSGNAVRRMLADRAGARTVLWVPLRRDGALLGFFAIYRTEVRPFSDKQIALLQNFAAQAVIAMENARLITETREALEQQTATAEILGVINSSPGHLAPVFDAILEKAHSLCGADFGGLLTYDGDRFRAVALHSVPPPFAQIARQGFLPSPSNPVGRLVAGAPLVHIADLMEIADAASDEPMPRAAVDLGGIRTLLMVPLRKDDALLGVITAYRLEVRPFSEKQIVLLQNFAAQAVIAMENARLITETQEALEQQTATAQVLQVINSSPGDLAPVFDAILEKAHTLCAAAFGGLLVRDGDQFRVVAIHGDKAFADYWRQLGPLRPPEDVLTPLGRLARGDRIVHVIDAREDEFFSRAASAELRQLFDIGGVRTLLLVSLRKDDAMLGVIAAFRQEVRPFTDKQIALLENFAAQAVIAMENARLLGELRVRTDEIAGWNRKLEERVAAQLTELERTGKLRRFLAPQLADLIVAQGDESILESHRREIVVVFCDLRGFTGFAERAEPEEVMVLLRDYHAAMGPIVARFEGTLDHYAGDGIMVFFNDPVPTPDPARRAIDMAVTMRAAAQELLRSWRRQGHDIGFGVGISQGYATLGQIGFAERMDYTAIGTVTNLAARLCAEAKDEQILVSRRVAIAVEDSAALEEIGDLALKGLSQAVAVYNVPW